MNYKTQMNGKERVMVISDMQIPAHHKDSIRFLAAVKEMIEPTEVVCIGDILDFAAISFHTQNPDLPSAGDELKQSKPVLKRVFELFPDVHLLESNHDQRVYRRAQYSGLATPMISPLLDIIDAPEGWKLVEDAVIDGVLYMHGDTGRGGMLAALKKAQDNFISVVQGHLHASFEISYFANRFALIFGMTVGCLMDHNHLAAAYGKKMHKKIILGTGAVINGYPVLIPMNLTPRGRWTGKLNPISIKK